MPIRYALAIACLLAGACPALALPRAPAVAGDPSIRFQATIGGAIRTSGSVTSAEAVLQQQPPEFNGCAIIKHKDTELGAYSLEIRINRGSFLLGGWQQGALDLSIDNYQPNVGTYKSPNIGGKFAFRGQSYGASVINSTVQVRDGGASGTYIDRQAHHLVPGTADAFTKAGTLTINASWHCATVFHLSDAPPQPAPGASTQNAPATFDLHVSPGRVGQLDLVYITGNAVMDGAASTSPQQVKLTVSLPGARSAVTVLIPAERADGLFHACFNQTNVLGTYGIHAISPGGGAVGDATFVVESGYDPPDEDAKLGTIAVEFERQIEKLAQTLPPSPAREDMQIKLDTLRVRLTDGLKQIAAFNTVLRRLYALFLDYAQDRATFAPVLHAIDRWATDARALETRIRAEMSAATQGSVRCDDVSRIAQGLKDMADLLAGIEAPMKEVAAFEKTYKDASGLGLEDNVNCVGTPSDAEPGKLDPQFEAALKGIDPADVPAAYMAATLTVAKDTLASASEGLFSAYCEQFQGPFSAHMHVDLSYQGKTWWSYNIYAAGTLSLRYVKGATAGKEQRLTGEFDGDITHFTVHEDALDVLFPKLKHDATYWHYDAVPGVPQHFRLPVSGTIASTSLLLSLDSSAGETIDNENNAAHSRYVLVSPYLLAPLVQTFSLPYKSMSWVVGKALADKPARLAIVVDRQHRVSYVQRTIANARRNPDAVSTYDLQIKACNPSCADGA